MTYRPEIDGLRALAVLPVIFFHAGFALFGGGFIGVDVFFVISGYLISTIIFQEKKQNKFSLLTFYERRARRILPALFFVMLFCIPMSWFFLSPNYLKDFGQSLVAVSFFSSNLLFWIESGYFGLEAELKPLLHTWSLAIEEQFYIIFPLLIIVLWRFGTKIIFFSLLIIFFLSLFFAHSGAINNPSANFFLLPSRAWELIVGVFCSHYLINKGYFESKKLNQVFSLIGFSMILFSITFYDESTPLPSLYSLVPTLGTALLIITCIKGTLIYNFLTFRPIVKIGLISYSAYLWHQPLLAFGRHAVEDDMSEFIIIFLCFLTIVLAFISWKWVEQPFRNKQIFNRNQIFKLAFVGIVFFSGFGLVASFTNGLEKLKIRYEFSDSEKHNYLLIKQSSERPLSQDMVDDNCKIWVHDGIEGLESRILSCSKEYDSPLIILGDSHAMNLHNIFARNQVNNFIISFAKAGCRPHEFDENCNYNLFVDFLKKYEYLNPTIIFHQSGSYLIKDVYGKNDPHLRNSSNIVTDWSNISKIETFLQGIASIDSNIIWLGPHIEYKVNPMKNLNSIKNIPKYSITVFEKLEQDIQNKFPTSNSIKFVPFSNFFKIDKSVVKDNCHMWRDFDHFSTCAEKIISTQADFDIF